MSSYYTPTYKTVGGSNYLSQSRVQGSPQSVTTNTAANVTANGITLTPGEWDLDGIIDILPSATTVVTQVKVCYSKTSATLSSSTDTSAVPVDGEAMSTVIPPGSYAPGAQFSVLLPRARVVVTADTTFYLVARVIFTTSNCSVYGSFSARRVFPV